ncbi:hypothetical protein [Streptomyces sp. NPDC054883]
MPIDPYAALNAMIRAEALRSTPPPARRPEAEDTGRQGNPPPRPAGTTPAE